MRNKSHVVLEALHPVSDNVQSVVWKKQPISTEPNSKRYITNHRIRT